MLNAITETELTLTLKATVGSGMAKPSRSYQDRQLCIFLSRMRCITLPMFFLMEILSLQNRQDDGKKDALQPPFFSFLPFSPLPSYYWIFHPGFRRLYETQVFMQKGSNLLIVFRNLDEYRTVFSMSLQALRRDSIVYNTKNNF